MKKLTILVDADGVMENLTEAWILYLNKKYGLDVKYEDVKEWDMSKAFPSLTRDEVYMVELEDELYDYLKPIKDGPKYLKKLLDEGHDIYVVTNTPYEIIKTKMEKCMKKYYPFLSWENYILATNKHIINGDVLIDDGIHNLEGGTYRKILVSAPYNENFDAENNGMIRVHNWKEIYDVIEEIFKK